MSDIIITTGNKIPGKKITEILGVVKGSTVRARILEEILEQDLKV